MDTTHVFRTEIHQVELRMITAWKVGRRLPGFLLTTRGLDELISTVFMLNPDAIWLLDDKIERPDGDRYEQTRNCEQICRKNKKGESESREEYNGIGK